MSARTRCAFCDLLFIKGDALRKESQEHIFRKKTLETLGHLNTKVPLQVFHGDGTVQEIQPSGITFVASGICQECNEGWMNDIDEASENVKLALARGTRTVKDLTEQEKHSLSLWVMKTAFATIAMDLGAPKGVDEDLKNFYRERKLPSYAAVFVHSKPVENLIGLYYCHNGYWRMEKPPYLSVPKGILGFKVGIEIDNLIAGLAYVKASGYWLQSFGHDMICPIAFNEPVSEVGDCYVVMRDDLPFSMLNNMMCNISLIHSALVPRGGRKCNRREIRMIMDDGSGYFAPASRPLVQRVKP